MENVNARKTAQKPHILNIPYCVLCEILSATTFPLVFCRNFGIDPSHTGNTRKVIIILFHIQKVNTFVLINDDYGIQALFELNGLKLHGR